MKRTFRFGRVGGLVAVAVVVVLPLLGGVPASASTGGDWWYDAYHVAAAHDAGWTGAGVKVAVIDAQIDPSLPVFDRTHLTVDHTPLCANAGASVTTTDPTSYHGSWVSSLIIGNGTGPGSVAGIAPDAHLTFYGDGVSNVLDCEARSTGVGALGDAITDAVKGGAKIISISEGGTDPGGIMVRPIADALAAGVIIVAGQPNDDGESPYPGAYNGVVAVNAVDSSGQLQEQYGSTSPDVQPGTTVVAAGVGIASPVDGSLKTGSSLATPLVAGMLADVWQKYPHATSSQLIQSLIHNTSSTDNPDGFGYGLASLTKMLSVNPSRYPDTNPLMGKSVGKPTQHQVAVAKKRLAAAPSTTTKAVPETTSGHSTVGSLLGTVALVGGIVLVVLIVGALILILALRKRARTSVKQATAPTPWGR